MIDLSTLTSEKMRTARRDGTFGHKYFTSSGELVAKDCSLCRNPKLLTEFSVVSEKSSRDGHHSRCFDCVKLEQAGFRKKYEGDPTKDPTKYGKMNSSRSYEEIMIDQAAIHPDGTKHCPTCGDTKELRKFQKNRTNKDGLNYQCSKCVSKFRSGRGDPAEVQARKYPDGTKTCSKCRTPKPLNKFYKNRTTPDGLHRNCRVCDSTHLRNKRKQAYESHWKANNIPFQCYICKGPYEQSDHVIPVVLGGSDEPYNRLPICAYHNGSKNGHPLRTWLLAKHHGIMDDILDTVENKYNLTIDPSQG